MKKFLPILIILVLLLFITNHASGIIKTLQDENTIGNLRGKLSEEEKKNQFLKERLFYAKTNQFVEEEARKKLGMSKPGEFIVIAPSSTPLDKGKIEINTKPNWRRWLELFF